MDWSLEVLGGGQEIGANSYPLKMNGVALLIDAGLHPKNSARKVFPTTSTLGKT